MPSVRVRRSTYFNLNDSSPQPEPRPLTTIFSSQPSSAPGRRRAHTIDGAQDTSRNATVIQGPTGDSSQDEFRRTLFETTRSRVQSQCVKPPRRPRLSFLEGSASTSRSPERRRPRSAGSEMVTVEGASADVRLPAQGTDQSLIGSALSLTSTRQSADPFGDQHHHDNIVEHLDVIDPQVGTVANLTNAANAIIVPPITGYPKFRKPIVTLDDGPRDPETASHHEDALDRHVEDVMRRRARFKRIMKGVWSFLKTPIGVLTAIYGFLVVFWGAAIVLFLARIINLHNNNLQNYWIELSSQVTNGLFTVTGIGLIPQRTLDTYRILKIWRYKRLTRKLRKRAGLPTLFDEDDLPDPDYDPNYVHVLTPKQQADLQRQQRKFAHSQTWYRAHGTETHRAFPINMALLICLFNDGNSIFQIFLCGTMWGLNRFERPAWTTGCLIPLSFLCGIASAVFIWRGGERTKRVEEVRERLRAALGKDNPFVPSEKEPSVVAPSSQSANGEGATSDMPRATSPGDASTLHVDTQKGGTTGSHDGKASPTNTEDNSPTGTWGASPTSIGGDSPTCTEGDSPKVPSISVLGEQITVCPGEKDITLTHTEKEV
ncbi:uncharacterized protein SCHCODRAFT_02575105 [Schizophyllum commune H4-8]|nr:uncharacterized protein SCHCODRAFT_02575105 [Schizophyllum commune H4-8]KAI5893472.1 hypothetical protein SCHCODRAFT_02575105 [Schizophyllum commune H4-8]